METDYQVFKSDDGELFAIFKLDVHKKIEKVILEDLKGKLISTQTKPLSAEAIASIKKVEPPREIIEDFKTIYHYSVDGQNVLLSNIANIETVIHIRDADLLENIIERSTKLDNPNTPKSPKRLDNLSSSNISNSKGPFIFAVCVISVFVIFRMWNTHSVKVYKK